MFELRDLAAAHTSTYLRLLNELGCSPVTVTQLTERQFPHAGVPEIVNCRSASYVTSGYRRDSLRMRNFNSSPVAALELLCVQIRDFAAWLQGNAQVTISGTPA
jgi:hypothetical protein